MTWWQGLVLGIVQGVTEFLPISSSGHLVVTGEAFGLQTPGVVVEVVLHVATLLAVVIVYRGTLWRLIRCSLGGQRDAWRYVAALAVATAPAAVAGLALADVFERAFDSLALVGVNFLVTGAMLWSARGRGATVPTGTPSWRQAGLVGLAQALAILPGISRSGTTVAAGLWLGMDPVKAAEFSFLMAIPTIAGAAVLQLPDLSGSVSGIGAGALAVGFVAGLLSGVAAIKVLIALLRRRAFHRFAPYCWSVGAATIVWAVVR